MVYSHSHIDSDTTVGLCFIWLYDISLTHIRL